MQKEYIFQTRRIGFSKWTRSDYSGAEALWGDNRVTKYICASGVFSPQDIKMRLETELSNDEKYGVQYWPIYSLETGELIGCCGLRPHGDDGCEIGFHLRPEYWGQGYGKEAASFVIGYAFRELRAKTLFAGHNPHNIASQKLLKKLGFIYTGDEFYAPTGLYHPSYILKNPDIIGAKHD